MWTIGRYIRLIENACSPFILPLWKGWVFRFSKVFGTANHVSVAETAPLEKLLAAVGVWLSIKKVRMRLRPGLENCSEIQQSMSNYLQKHEPENLDHGRITPRSFSNICNSF